MCALVYQLLWTRWLGLIVGHFATATATVVTAFMAGLALGTWALGRRAARLSPAAALRLYAGLEAGLAAFAALTPLLLATSSPVVPALARAAADPAVRALLCFGVLLPPTIMMGGTLPAVVQAMSATAPARLGPLYALNTIGGASGPLLAAFVLLPALGLRRSAWLAAAINAIVAALAWRLARRLSDAPPAPAGESPAPSPGAASPAADPAGRAGTASDPALRGATARPPAAAKSATAPAPVHQAAGPPDPPGDDLPSPPPRWLPYVLAGAGGFLALGFEIALTRQFVLTITGGSVYGFAVILSSYLIGIALGAWLVKRRPPATAAGALGGFALAQGVAWLFAATTPFWDAIPPLLVRVWWNPLPFWMLTLFNFSVVLALVLLLTTASGFALPALVGALPGRDAAAVGRLFAANTVGAVLGSSLTGFVFLVRLGLANTLLALGALALLTGLAAWLASRPRRDTALLVWAALPAILGAGVAVLASGRPPLLVLGLLGLLPAAAVAALAARGDPAEGPALRALIPAPFLLLLPFAVPPPDAGIMNAGMYNRPHGFRPGEGASPSSTAEEAAQKLGRIIYQKDSLTARIAVRAINTMEMSFVVNGKPDGSTSLVDMYTQIFMAHLPALMHPRPRRVLVIGCGTGTTTGSLTLHPEIEEIHLCEIEPAQIEVARIFGRHNHHGVDHPRVRLHLDDARHWLMTDDTKYDLIVSEPSNLWVSGMVNLFTAEFYAEVRRHLNPGGVFFQWIHYYRVGMDDVKGMLATHTREFPETLFWLHEYGDAFLLSRADGGAAIEIRDWERRLAQPRIAEDLKRIRIEGLETLSFLLWGPEDIRRWRGDAPVCTDDRPYLEFTTPMIRYSPQDVQDMRRKMQFFGPVTPIPINGETADLRRRLADGWYERGSFARALAEYRRALELNPRLKAARDRAEKLALLMSTAAAPASPSPLRESFTR
jgi:spermidine synthase